MVDASDVLFDDRALVEVFGHIVAGRADEFDSSLLRLPVRTCADESGKERMVDVDDRDVQLVEEILGQYLHIAGQDDEVGIALEDVEELRFRRGLVRSLRWHVEEGDAEAAYIVGDR